MEEPLESIKTYRAADLREYLSYYRITMPPRATKQQLYDRLRACMLTQAVALRSGK